MRIDKETWFKMTVDEQHTYKLKLESIIAVMNGLVECQAEEIRKQQELVKLKQRRLDIIDGLKIDKEALEEFIDHIMETHENEERKPKGKTLEELLRVLRK